MRFRLKSAALAVMATTALVAGLALPAGATTPTETVTVVADHLNNPRQIAKFGNSLYVAEAGTGGTECLPDGVTCIGFTGSVTKYRRGVASRIQTGLLSVASPEGDVVGVDSLAFRGQQLYGIATGACADLPPDIAAQAGQVLRLEGGSNVTSIGSASSVECNTDPDGQGVDTDPYGLAQRGGTFYVADAAGNDIVQIKKGVASLTKVLSTTGQPVPTSLAFGPDGALYIGTLNFEAGPGGAAVMRLDLGTGDLTTYADGLTAITGIAFGPDGTLYASEWTTGFDQNGPSPDGDVAVIPPGGGSDHTAIGVGALHFPGGVAVMGGDVYVSNWSIATGDDGPFGPGNHGQMVRIHQTASPI
ncbi:MAG: ScyD/ScyE family protein [Acidimicrobiales bacterium]